MSQENVEIVRLGETEVKELLTITVAQVAHFYFEKRQAAPSN